MIWVTVEDVIALHSRVIEKSGGIDGLRDRALLEAAVAAPLQSFGGADFYPSVPENKANGWCLASVVSNIELCQIIQPQTGQFSEIVASLAPTVDPDDPVTMPNHVGIIKRTV